MNRDEVEARLAEVRESYARAPFRRPRRRVSPATRQRLSNSTRAYYARRSQANPETSPAERVRPAQRLTRRQAAGRCGVSAQSIYNAERRPELVGARTWERLSRGYGVPVDVLNPDAG